MTAAVLDRAETLSTDDLAALRRGVCVLFSTSLLGVRRKVKSGAVTTDADRSFIHVQKTLLESPALDAIRKRDSEIRDWLIARTVGPSIFRDGIYLVPIALLKDIDAVIKRYIDEERPALVETFLDAYEPARNEAAKKLGTLFDPRDYPARSDARGRFSARVQFIAFEAPNQLAEVAPDIYEREERKIAEEMRATLDECRTAIRSEFAELVTHLADRLQPGDDGKKKILRDSAVTKITEWLELFEARNTIGNDGELARLVEDVRGVMRGVTPDDLRGSRRFRETVKEALTNAAQRAGELVDIAPARAFNFD